MKGARTPVTPVMAELLSELVRRIMVVVFCGTGSILTGVETVRAIENRQFVAGDWLTPVASAVFGSIALCDVVRIFCLLQAIFRQVYAAEFALHSADSTILSPVLSRPASKISALSQIIVTGIIAAVVGMIQGFATMRGETIDSITQVCVAAALTMLSLCITLVLWSRGFRMRAIVLGTGAIAVSLFWVAVAALVAFDQLNFRNASPIELAMVSIAVLGGGIALAGAWGMTRIRGRLKRHSQRSQAHGGPPESLVH